MKAAQAEFLVHSKQHSVTFVDVIVSIAAAEGMQDCIIGFPQEASEEPYTALREKTDRSMAETVGQERVPKRYSREMIRKFIFSEITVLVKTK